MSENMLMVMIEHDVDNDDDDDADDDDDDDEDNSKGLEKDELPFEWKVIQFQIVLKQLLLRNQWSKIIHTKQSKQCVTIHIFYKNEMGKGGKMGQGKIILNPKENRRL